MGWVNRWEKGEVRGEGQGVKRWPCCAVFLHHLSPPIKSPGLGLAIWQQGVNLTWREKIIMPSYRWGQSCRGTPVLFFRRAF